MVVEAKFFCRTLLVIMLFSGVSGSAASQLLDPEVVHLRSPQTKNLYSSQQLQKMTPTSPNPYLSLLPEGVEPDWDYWRPYMRAQSKNGRPASFTSVVPTPFSETEPNNSQATANHIAMFGTGNGDTPSVNVSGAFSAAATPVPIAEFPEDNGSIPLAGNTGVTTGNAVKISSHRGDGPFGSAGTGSGDYDFYLVPNVQAGQSVSVDIDTVDLGATFDSYVAIWDAAGNLLAYNDDQDTSTGFRDSFLIFSVPSLGSYYVSVGSWLSEVPSNPFNSASGIGIGSEGPYDVTIGLDSSDSDYFSFDLEAGDIFAATISGASPALVFLDPTGVTRIGSDDDASFIYPGSSPLPGGGNAALAYVIEESGRYSLRPEPSNLGSYTANLRVFRPVLETAAPSETQILFIDFNGATLNMSIFGGSGVRTLSPLSSFLSGWQLGSGHENQVINAILAVLEEDIRDDLLFPGGNNPGFDIEIRNSRDHADPFGQPNVSRVIVGGTIAESGISTIGIAQSIDVGNFVTGESAFVLLDLLSAPFSNPNSLNKYTLGGGATKVDVIGAGVGNIVAHEAGHFFGNFHTDNTFTTPNIMDQGGNLSNTVGVGPDSIFGNANDIDVDFGVEIYNLSEGFEGIEDTLNVVAFGVTTASNDMELYVDQDALLNGNGSLAAPFNNVQDAVDTAAPDAAIHIFPSSGSETFLGANRLNTPMTLLNESPGGGVVRIGTP